MAERNQELADFLRRARSQVDPDRTGLPADGRVRRVPGLRREEVAQLAQVSSDYYTRLEQGRPITPSPVIVDAIARALELGPAGHEHLRHLIGRTGRDRQPRRAPAQRPRPGLLQLMDTLDGVPALLLGRRTDVLAANRMARALLTDFATMPARDRNYARWMFLAPDTRELLTDWADQARVVVENLRLEAGRDPLDAATQTLVGELTIASPEFAAWWQEHRVFQRTWGDKRFHHPIVGDLTLQYESLTLPGDDDQTLFLYTARAGTVDRESLDLLASWSLTAHAGEPGPTARPARESR
ncbi:helix-turn-helix transcriptional regulator [Nakamurella leprariae]|uniref:Helix-turn-helix domain-containing protein n=1 Tax=Nakamurella leprariae TaxID=2803911 RepID=A0A938YH79_9ACTN|nr:helix-turn-helix transcriptional regulator [Nakamurella leprariae]MBM9469446.1 helix-turn-helix domain-containing protein [Nakamurella leprariae]